jgi:Domain of unknown function (DUF4335)
MELQRSYNLPNCTLVLDGLSDMSGDNASRGNNASRLAILMSATCTLMGQAQPISGDRSFLEALAHTVSRYAQTCLSGVGRSLRPNAADRIQLSPLGPGKHQLKVWPDANSAPQSFDLTTVQLFDLVEAIDQFLADNLSLPDMQLHLSPMSRRLVASSEPLAKRIAAPALGLSGLAIATVALVTMPVPQLKRPDAILATRQTTSQPAQPTLAPSSPASAPAANPDASSSPSVSPAASPAPIAPNADTAPATLRDRLDQSPQISDATQIATIQDKLTQKIESAWTAQPEFTTPLTYRVSASADGNVLGYRGADAATQQFTGGEPLRELVYLPPAGATNEAIAQYEVVLTPEGKLTVRPWATAGSPVAEPSPTPSVSPAAIEPQAAVPTAVPSSAPSAAPTAIASSGDATATIQDPQQLETLTTNLYDQIDKTWKTEPSFQGPIAYRVTTDSQGNVMAIEPQDTEATNFAVETPLSGLKKGGAATGGTANFKVIFKPSGALEVSPWDGF